MPESSEKSLLTQEIRATIGYESEPIVASPVSSEEIRRYSYAIDDLNPLYLDPSYAAQTHWGGVIAPPDFFQIYRFEDHPLNELAEDGTPPIRLGVPRLPSATRRVVFAGADLSFFQPIRPGDVITRQSKVLDVYERLGRLGPMLFWITETAYTNQRAEAVATSRDITILR